MNLGEHIFRHRSRLGWSQDRLAAALEVSRQSVSKWETGAAVPDLDKLIKMCDLFEISLDELTGRDTAPQDTVPVSSPEPETQIIYVEKPVFSPLNRNQMFGGVLSVGAFLLALILHSDFSVAETAFLVLPVVACGIVFLFTTHPLFYSSWISAFAYWTYFFILARRWENHPFLIILGVLLVSSMALNTLRLRKNGVLKIPAGIMALGGIILILLLILLCLNCMPLAEAFITEHPAVPTPVQGG